MWRYVVKYCFRWCAQNLEVIVYFALIAFVLFNIIACTGVQVSPFERCVKSVAGDSVIATQRMSAADWCAARVGV